MTNICPYVYRLDHPITGEFYIGYRSANKVPGIFDLGHKYFTSSKQIKPRFHEFQITIIAECFNKDFAYDLEQQLIYEEWDNSLILNKHYSISKQHFKNSGNSDETRAKIGAGNKGKAISSETRAKLRYALTGRILSADHKDKMSIAHKDIKKGPHSDETRAKIGAGNKGKLCTDETKAKISAANKGRILSDETKAKLSTAKTGIKLSDDHKAKMRKPRKNTSKMRKQKPVVTCPHCEKSGGSNAMARYHFDNCKYQLSKHNNVIG